MIIQNKKNQVLQTTSRCQVIPVPEVKLKEKEQKQENAIKIEKVSKKKNHVIYFLITSYDT